MRTYTRRPGFSAVEALVVMAICCIFLALIINLFIGIRARQGTVDIVERAGDVRMLHYDTRTARWCGVLDRQQFYVDPASPYSDEIVATLHKSKLKDWRVRGIIKYAPDMPDSAMLVAVEVVDEYGAPVDFEIDDNDLARVRRDTHAR